MTKVLYYTTIILLTLVIFGCSKSTVDVTPPTMDNVSYTPDPVVAEICGFDEPVVFRLTNNAELTFNIEFNDDEALSQYKVDIHNNFDCHGHGAGGSNPVVTVDVENQTTDWSVLDIQDLSGTSASITKTLTVPDNVTAGNYHYHTQVIDESGNDSPFTNFNSLKIRNLRDTVPPVITVQEPTASTFSKNRGEAIRFVGKVTDIGSLSVGGNGILFLTYTSLSSGNTFSTNTFFPFDQSVNEEYDFDFEFTIPQTLISNRMYQFTLGCNDGVRNVAELVSFEVEVL